LRNNEIGEMNLNLTGKVTPAGWQIGPRVTFAADHTGGHFSDCYMVEKDGTKAFLKALDIEKFSIDKLLGLMAGFQYESELLELCRARRLGRIVQVIEADKVERDPNASPVLRYVPFLIFELAEGDIRDSVDLSKAVSDRWRFQILHQTTLALLQLHKEHIAHQDLKPSNVLRFEGQRLKLGDLGRSSLRGKPAPHDALDVAGARNYAPFEQTYAYLKPDWLERRLSSDVFHLGCLLVFSFTNICFPEFVLSKLAAAHRPGAWGDSYELVIDHIQAAMVEALADLAPEFPERFRADLVNIVKDLCHPSPTKRGRTGVESKTSTGPLWLERYVSRFDILEKKARMLPVTKHA
jgi:eukaryotic-like serine/threonine-protein kinase